ncbi:hypothetical protein R1sor_014417 [Riccia sorocarpa]|uniref:SnoaL-like domain-containing protein n=1 Tax=Riccia sorocarpa TaxID=122646 RepID=A0ABD3H9L0_9MARC
MAAVKSISVVSTPFSRRAADTIPVASAVNFSLPCLARRGSTKNHAAAAVEWSKSGVTCRRMVGVRAAAATTQDDAPSSSTQLVELPRKAADIAREFYELVNQRDYVKVSELFAEDCRYEDFTFPEPVKGRKEVVQFFEKVMTSMGPELKFVIDDITRDDPDAAGVIWHLEWRGKTFPYSRGCSFYRCEVNSSGQRQIKFARDIVEPAAKPGDIAMGAIKLVTGLFERFPKLIERI